MIRSVSASPEGEYFRVTTIKDDLSYIVPVSSVGTVEEIWDADGNALALIDEEDVNEQAQDNNGGGRGQRSGGGDGNDDDKRGLAWRTDGGPGMVFLQLEARPEAGDDAEEEEAEEESEEREPRKDRVMYWLPPSVTTIRSWFTRQKNASDRPASTSRGGSCS